MNAVSQLAFVVVCSLAAIAADDNLLPMQKGDAWTYTATVRWTVINSNRVRSTRVTWKSEVVDTVEHGKLRAALLKGFVSDLAWWDPDSGRRGDWLIVRWDGSYFMLHDRDATETYHELQKIRDGADVPQSLQTILRENPWFRAPLRAGARFCEPDQEQRTDRSYCWFVESSRLRALNVPGVASRSRREYELIYRTNPEHEIVSLVPGVGVTSYRFAHHGTVAEASARLVKVEHAGR